MTNATITTNHGNVLSFGAGLDPRVRVASQEASTTVLLTCRSARAAADIAAEVRAWGAWATVCGPHHVLVTPEQ